LTQCVIQVKGEHRKRGGVKLWRYKGDLTFVGARARSYLFRLTHVGGGRYLALMHYIRGN